MPRGGAHFTSEELDLVLSHYDIGKVKETAPLNIGNARAPKRVIISEKGKFLLKRRQKGKDDIYHIAFAHAVQTHLEQKGFPVAKLFTTRKEKNTVLNLQDRAYELFCFVEGSRYNGSTEAAADAGRHLAKFHDCLADFACHWKPLRQTFHDSSGVRGHLKFIGSKKNPRASDSLRKTSHELLLCYNHSSIAVNQLGFDSWDEQIIHGDWHPGNLLFSSGKVVCVLDFDSPKLAPAVTDLANGVLQFSIVAGRPNPLDWPSYLDQAKLANFVAGYRQVTTLQDNMLDALPELMVETMIAEAILPIATTGFFGNLSGMDFLKMIHRKCEWINQNHKLLKEVIFD